MTVCAVSPQDPAAAVVDAFRTALGSAFNDADAVMPPEGGGSDRVWLIFGDNNGIPWDPSDTRGKSGCSGPFLWVRVDRRYRSRVRDFPAAYIGKSKCEEPLWDVLAIEVGIARCVDASEPPKLAKVEEEAWVALDDSWRVGLAMYRAAKVLKDSAVATDTIAPIGPEGRMIAWTGMAYVQL